SQMKYASKSVPGSLFEDVDDEEEADPHDIDEVPVVRHRDSTRGLTVREVLHSVGATDHEEEGDEPTDDVEAVEAGRDVEGASVRARTDGDVLAHEVGALENLTRDKHCAHRVGQEEPLDHSPLGGLPSCRVSLETFGGEHAELTREARGDEDRGVDERVPEVENLGLRGPEAGRHRAESEVDRKEPSEEHHFASEPDDRAYCNSVRSLQTADA